MKDLFKRDVEALLNIICCYEDKRPIDKELVEYIADKYGMQFVKIETDGIEETAVVDKG